MAFHHVAIVAKDVKASHEFYSGPMGFRLAKVEAVPTEGGWAKHLFYDTGNGEMLALWDLHDPTLAGHQTAISTGLGLPIWINHIAFEARGLDDLEKRRLRWLEHGVDCMEVDHGWCTSIYATDPSGNLVEFCASTRQLGPQDEAEALKLLDDPQPKLITGKAPRRFKAGGGA